MAQSKGARSKGGSLAVGSAAGTVNVVLSASTAKDLLNALAQAVGTGSKKAASLKAKPKAASKATSKAAPKAASRATSKAAPKAASKARPK